jgi:predicted transcriptional regulator
MVRVMSDGQGKSKPGTVLVTLPPELDEALDRVAAVEYTSRAQVARRAIGEWLRQQGELSAALAEVG